MIDPEIRKRGIGGSDVAALFGVDEFKDAFGVWAEKKAEPAKDRLAGDLHITAGKILEPAVIALYSHMTGREVIHHNLTGQRPDRPFQVFSPDGLVIGEKRGVEAKVVFWGQRAYWGPDDDATPRIPDRVLFQCWWYMSALDYPAWDVAALLGEGLPRIYTVKRLDAEAEGRMLARAEEWWKRYVVGDDIPPLGNSDEARRWLQQTFPSHRSPDMREATPDEAALLDEYVVLHMAQRKLRKDKHAIELKILAAIQGKEGLNWSSNAFTWRKTKSMGVDWKSMAIGLRNEFIKDAEERRLLEEFYLRPGVRRVHVSHPLLNRSAKEATEEEAA